MTETTSEQVLGRAEMRDEDSSIYLERYQEPEGDVTVAIWGTEDVNPTLTLAYTLVSERTLIAFLSDAGYEVTPRQAVN